MTELAPLRLDSRTTLDWESAAIPGMGVQDLAAIHVNARREHTSHLEAQLGFPEPCRIATIGPATCMWMGPSEWLLTASTLHAGFLQGIDKKATKIGAVTVTASDRFAVVEFTVEAEHFAALTGVMVDNFGTGRVVRTRLADIPVMIAVLALTQFRLFLDRSHALHFRAWLDQAV